MKTESEIEDWYEQENERIFNNYNEGLAAKKDKKKLEEEYKKNVANLRKKYYRIMEKTLNKDNKAAIKKKKRKIASLIEKSKYKKYNFKKALYFWKKKEKES